MRLTEIESGAILIDGCNIGGIPLNRLRSAVAVIPQTPFLFQVSTCAHVELHFTFGVLQ